MTVFEKQCKVKIIPTSKRAKDRIHNHGEIMWLKKVGTFQGSPAFNVESLEKTWNRGTQTWGGWFTDREAKFERIDE